MLTVSLFSIFSLKRIQIIHFKYQIIPNLKSWYWYRKLSIPIPVVLWYLAMSMPIQTNEVFHHIHPIIRACCWNPIPAIVWKFARVIKHASQNSVVKMHPYLSIRAELPRISSIVRTGGSFRMNRSRSFVALLTYGHCHSAFDQQIEKVWLELFQAWGISNWMKIPEYIFWTDTFVSNLSTLSRRASSTWSLLLPILVLARSNTAAMSLGQWKTLVIDAFVSLNVKVWNKFYMIWVFVNFHETLF